MGDLIKGFFKVHYYGIDLLSVFEVLAELGCEV